MTNEKLQTAIDAAFAIDKQIAELNQQVSELIGDLRTAKRSAAAGVLIGMQHNLKDSFFRKLAGRLQDFKVESSEHTCIDINNAPTGQACEACRLEKF